MLASSLDYAKTLNTVAHLAVPDLADLCVIDVLRDDGTIDRVAAHASPAPWRIDARLPRSAYVAGEIFEIHCIHSGSTVTG